MKFISQGYGALWYQTMGAVPVNVSWPDMYTSMEKGIVEGSIGAYGPAIGSGMIDLYRYYTTVPGCMRVGLTTTVMNTNSFNKLPADIQKIITDLEPWYAERRTALEKEFDGIGVGMAKEKGSTFIDLSPEVYNEWLAAAKPVHLQWIKESEAKGKPAQLFYDTLMQLIEQYK
jgi:TRAP-type C4-dicarboxylate transport system substrate-binding protein